MLIQIQEYGTSIKQYPREEEWLHQKFKPELCKNIGTVRKCSEQIGLRSNKTGDQRKLCTTQYKQIIKNKFEQNNETNGSNTNINDDNYIQDQRKRLTSIFDAEKYVVHNNRDQRTSCWFCSSLPGFMRERDREREGRFS